MDPCINAAVVITYLVGVTIAGVWIGRKRADTTEGYYLGDRKFKWVTIGFSLFATNVGIGMYVGGSGKAYKIGLAALTPEILGAIGMLLSAFIFIPIYLRSGITTLPQFLEQRFNQTAKLCYGGVFVALAIFVSPLTMFTGSLAILGLFGYPIDALHIFFASLLIASTVGVYSVMGGLTAVVVTDVIQTVVMLIGSLLLAIIGLVQVGGLSTLLANLPPDMLRPLRPHDDPEFPWSAMVSGQLLASCLWAFCNIGMLQRVLGAKDLSHARKGMLLGAALKLLGLLTFVLPGMIASQLYPDIAPDTAYGTLIRELLPVGISGLALAGLVAALMSSQDSGINALASIVSIDIYPALRPQATPHHAIVVGKSVAVLSIAWGVAAAPMFLSVDQGIFDLVLKFGGFLMVPNGLCYLLGRFWLRGTAEGCVTTLICGMVLGAYYNVCSTAPSMHHFLPDLILRTHYYHVLPFFAAALAAIFIVTSLLTPAPGPEKTRFMFTLDA